MPSVLPFFLLAAAGWPGLLCSLPEYSSTVLAMRLWWLSSCSFLSSHSQPNQTTSV